MFTQQAPRMFNLLNIQAIDDQHTGVYGLFREGIWIYVGKGNIRQRLLAHLRGDNPEILYQMPTHYVDEIWQDPYMSNREKELTLSLKPLCNKKFG